MITSTDAKGNTTEYTYNALGQVTNKKVPFDVASNGNIVYTNYSYNYGGLGNVTYEMKAVQVVPMLISAINQKRLQNNKSSS